MLIENQVELPLTAETAWDLLLDIERTAACVPGVELRRVEGGELEGVARVKVGPVTVRYEGTAELADVDAEARRFNLRMEGRELRGRGGATASMAVSVAEAPGGSTVALVTELDVTGRVAQFGRDVLASVSARLLEQFAANLKASASGPSASGQATPGEAAPAPAARSGPGVRHEPPPPEPLSLLGAPDPRTALAVLAGVVLLALLIRRGRRR